MRVKLVPALEDNYMYLLVDESTNQAAAIDPVEPDKLLKAVKEEEVNLTSVLTTHHHWDHAGGNDALVRRVDTKLLVYGGDDRIGALTNKVQHGDKFQVGNLNVECLFTPCHTSGHICYHVTDQSGEPGVVFTGDTLFIAGCGKFFEGSPEQMHNALVGILSKLPPETKVFCGHEYTLSNLAFAHHVEPNNQDISNKMDWAQGLRRRDMPTVPSTIGEELLYNPFMRVNVGSVQEHAKQCDPVAVMAHLRSEKDRFKAPRL
ncbi:PREDICTED: hydroxyacylglutathione hydrolase, mitochondrial-like [Priapulus caudatus]|uniref:hydroxyacylglutathione hydrolase n=1 Tax=Priapulus caudatus TaxID=37621 RepID=A0ABM1E6E3_PRICU|nr:PREDICTED: hydroxyacylglutathione hydrolase, mitochondrial-like [Priapulus caudatus]